MTPTTFRVVSNKVGTRDGDILRRYLDEVGEHPLLTAADEVRLGGQLQQAREAAETLADATPRTAAVTRRLRRAVADGEAARAMFIQSNLRLVVSIARRYERSGLEMLDLIQEGNLGLMRAVEKFDHTKGFKFSTYATWWIRQSIGRALADTGRTIRVPSHVRDVYSLIDQSTERLSEELDRAPTVEEIAELSGVSTERVTLVQQHRRPLVSLSRPLGEESDSELSDIIVDDAAVAPFDAAASALESVSLDAQLQRLKPRERAVLQWRFGLDGSPRTLAEIGEMLELTRERVRQIEARGMGKLRHPSVSRAWREGPRRPAAFPSG
jgi:RNA polymerase sigma factor (sigma-70 family)